MKIYISILFLTLLGCSSKPNSNKSDNPEDKILPDEVKINIALLDLQKKEFVKLISSTKDTVYDNKRTKQVNHIEYGGSLQYPFSGTKLHKYLLSQLPNGYAGDSSVNIRTTTLTISIIHYIKTDWWNFDYTLWYEKDAIMSSSDDFYPSKGIIYKLPDMSKYGY